MKTETIALAAMCALFTGCTNVKQHETMNTSDTIAINQSADDSLLPQSLASLNGPRLTDAFEWTREPKECIIREGRVEITTRPHTDLWQRTYYHFRNDNAPVFQMETEQPYFSFVVKTDFTGSHTRFDQCGIVMYLDSENWLKASVEYENSDFQHLGSVVTNHGYSDWATTAIPASERVMWYRLSRRADDYCIECSQDGEHFSQMRVCPRWPTARSAGG